MLWCAYSPRQKKTSRMQTCRENILVLEQAGVIVSPSHHPLGFVMPGVVAASAWHLLLLRKRYLPRHVLLFEAFTGISYTGGWITSLFHMCILYTVSSHGLLCLLPSGLLTSGWLTWGHSDVVGFNSHEPQQAWTLVRDGGRPTPRTSGRPQVSQLG